MTHEFDKDYWEDHWRRGDGPGSMAGNPPHPYLARELDGLPVGTALDAGCGAGAEAVWLAAAGWQVTAADISSEALAAAREKAEASGVGGSVDWVEADLCSWEPGGRFDLVTTHYAHPAMPQLDFYARIAGWVAPGGTLLLVGHRGAEGSGDHGHGHGHGHGDGHGEGHGKGTPAEAAVTAAAVVARLDAAIWEVVTADEPDRTLGGPADRAITLRDVVVRATRRR